MKIELFDIFIERHLNYERSGKRLPAVRETWVWSLDLEDPLEKEMTTHSSTLAWKIPWTEEPNRLQSMGWQRVRHDWVTSLHFTFHQSLEWRVCPILTTICSNSFLDFMEPLMIMLSSQVLLTLHLVRDLKNKLAISILGFIILPEQNTRKKGNFSEWHYKLVMLLGLCGSLVKIQKKKKKKDGGKSLLKVRLIHCWRPKSRNIQTYNVIVKMTWEDISHNATQRGLGGEGRSIHT